MVALKLEVVLRKERNAMNYDRNVQIVRLALIVINIAAIVGTLCFVP